MACKHELVTVLSRDGGEGDPQFPIVTCPHCMARWIGHRDEDRVAPQEPCATRSSSGRIVVRCG